jgi:hypothetical protein
MVDELEMEMRGEEWTFVDLCLHIASRFFPSSPLIITICCGLFLIDKRVRQFPFFAQRKEIMENEPTRQNGCAKCIPKCPEEKLLMTESIQKKPLCDVSGKGTNLARGECLSTWDDSPSLSVSVS